MSNSLKEAREFSGYLRREFQEEETAVPHVLGVLQGQRSKEARAAGADRVRGCGWAKGLSL